MPDTQSVYTDLKNALDEFKHFLDSETGTIKTAVTAIKAIPQVGQQVTDLLTKLITLMQQIRDAVANVNIGSIPGLDQMTKFTGAVQTLLTTAKPLVQDQGAAIDDVLSAVSVIGGLSALGGQVQQDIVDTINAIITSLKSIQGA